MNIETIILLIIAICATLKAYFEWKKAKVASHILHHTIKSVEVGKDKMSLEDHRKFTSNMYKYIVDADCNTAKMTKVVKSILEPPRRNL